MEDIKKAKGDLKLSLARDVKNNKSFLKYIEQKRKLNQTASLIHSSVNEGDLATNKIAEVLNDIFCLSLCKVRWQ